jgi:putative methionine-R-sulfoxide reductase with GAF domain
MIELRFLDMSTASKTKDLKTELAELAKKAKSAHDLMSGIVQLLQERMLKYNWVGFYMLEASLENPMLVLGALSRSHDATHENFIAPGHLRRGRLYGKDSGRG